MGWAMDRYLSDEVLEAVQRLHAGRREARASRWSRWRSPGCCASRTSRRRSSAPHAPSRSTRTPRPPGIELSADVLEAIDEALGDVVVTGPQLANFVEEGVKHR